jgi:hypothetical protein
MRELDRGVTLSPGGAARIVAPPGPRPPASLAANGCRKVKAGAFRRGNRGNRERSNRMLHMIGNAHLDPARLWRQAEACMWPCRIATIISDNDKTHRGDG